MSNVADDLRRWVEKSIDSSEFPVSIAEREHNLGGDYRESERKLFASLANRIEAEEREIIEAQSNYGERNGKPFKDCKSITEWLDRYYIARPCFEDGEPIQDSDLEEIGAMATCCVYTDGSWIFNPDKYEDEANPKPWDEQKGCKGDCIKRPQLKVLDADGVEIKVGDTVWDEYGDERVVTKIVSKHEIYVRRPTGTVATTGYSAEALTHREHDSYERVCNDIRNYLKFDITESRDAITFLNDIAERVALIERSA